MPMKHFLTSHTSLLNITCRSILKEHRSRLPPVMRKLGDDYVKAEFKSHKNAKPEHLIHFFPAWEDYLLKIRLQRESFGANLNDNMKKNLTDDQRMQLLNLKEEALRKEEPKE